MRTFVREKKIYCGADYLEVDVFNYTEAEKEKAKSGARSKKEVESTPKQVDWNDINARRRFLQIVHTNFGAGDLHVTLTYAPENLPATIEDGERELKNYLRRIAYRRGKAGLRKSQTPAFQCLTAADGQTPEWVEVAQGAQISRGGNLIRSFGEFPNVESVSSLWEILEPTAHRKYSLSVRACLAMLERAERKGKKLPLLLSAILKLRAGLIQGNTLLILDEPPTECTSTPKPPEQ